MSNTTFKLGDRVVVEGYGVGAIRSLRENKALVEFTSYGGGQYAFKLEELTKIERG